MRVRDRLTALAGAVWRRRLLLAALGLAIVVGPPLVLGIWAARTVTGVDLSRLEDAALIYAAGQVLAPGVSVEAADLPGALRRLGYREIQSRPAAPGQFRRDAGAWEIHLHPRQDPRSTRPALLIRLAVDGSRIRQVSTGVGEPLEEIELEPETLTGLGGAANQLRHPVPLATVPQHLVQALLAAEDHRFFEHHGVDVRAVARAVWVNLRRGALAQGGSTLTQQLVKNLVLTPKRTWGRKMREAVLALAIERRYSKEEILAAYLNGVYLGQHGGFAVYGVGAAARSFFGKDVERLTLGEAATLAAIIRAPNTYSPVQHPDRARERRNTLLRRMRELGMLDDARLAQATKERLVVQRGTAINALGPYFADWVWAQVEQIQPVDEASSGGLRIYTTLNPILQRAAEAALVRGLDRLEGQYRALRRSDPAARLQGAIVALDARTGEIRAMVGGRDYGQSQFNRVTQARRQPGSAFKPFVYLAALGQGPRGEPPNFTPASLLEDRPVTIGTGRTAWTPRNYENRYEGTVTVRRALEQSLNAATVWMADSIGYDAVVRSAREAGFTSPMEAVPALVLGSFEVTPIELASGYAALASGGSKPADRASCGGGPRGRGERAARGASAGREARRGLPGHPPAPGGHGPRHRRTGARARRARPRLGEDGNDERGPRHVVRRLHVPARRARVGRVRPARRAPPLRCAGRASDLGRVHAHRAGRGPGPGSRGAPVHHLPGRGRRQREARHHLVPGRHSRGLPGVDRAARRLPRSRPGRRGPLVLPPPLRVGPLGSRHPGSVDPAVSGSGRGPGPRASTSGNSRCKCRWQ